jgi:AcrR family transcriptional regulator
MSQPQTKKVQAASLRRHKIMITAEQLFGQRGIDAVSLNEINKAAGQRNTSALHYHFGSKSGLLEAIMLEHYEGIEVKINLALDKLEAQKQLTCREIVAAMTAPYVDKLGDKRGIDYLRIMAQQLSISTDWVVKGRLGRGDTARYRIFQLFKRENFALPSQVREIRMVLYTTLLFHSLAAYSRFEQSSDNNPMGEKIPFMNNLVDSLVGVLLPPVSQVVDV